MAKPEKKYECLSNEQKNFLKKALGIRKLEDLDLSILKELKERMKLPGSRPRLFKRTIDSLRERGIFLCDALYIYM